MDRRNPVFTALLLFIFPIAAWALGQSNSPNSPATAPSGPQSALQTAAVSPVPSVVVQPAAKKVWTNDDLSSVPGDSGASSNRGPAPKLPAPAAKPSASKSKNARWYNDQIAALRTQLPPLEHQISQLQAALRGEMVDSTRKYGALKPDDWPQQLEQLQHKRDGIDAKIAALEDAARHSDIPARQIQ